METELNKPGCNGGRNEAALAEIRKRADADDAEALYELATLYYKGRGVDRNPKEAFRCCLHSARLGFVRSFPLLGVLYEFGVGVGKDECESMKWYRKAADEGNAVARYKVGDFYLRGVSVTQNADEAVRWFWPSCGQGIPACSVFVGLVL